MEFLGWFQVSFADVVATAGLLFAGFGLLLNAKERRAGNLLEVTKQHRELWMWIRSRPELTRAFATDADLQTQKLTDEERSSINFVILHFAANYRAAQQGMFKLPEKIGIDIRGFFSRPIPHAVWNSMKQFYDDDFVRFVESNLRATVNH